MNTTKKIIDEAVELVRNADAIALRYLRKMRKDGSTSYKHGVRVASDLAKAGMPPYMIASGMLHDVLEDSEYVSVAYLRKHLSADVAWLVDKLTKRGKTSKHVRKHLLNVELAGWDAVIIKLVDNTHNLETVLCLKDPKAYVAYGQKIQDMGVRVLGEDHAIVIRHLKTLRAARTQLTNLPA